MAHPTVPIKVKITIMRSNNIYLPDPLPGALCSVNYFRHPPSQMTSFRVDQAPNKQTKNRHGEALLKLNARSRLCILRSLDWTSHSFGISITPWKKKYLGGKTKLQWVDHWPPPCELYDEPEQLNKQKLFLSQTELFKNSFTVTVCLADLWI